MKVSEMQEMMLETADSIELVWTGDRWMIICDERPVPSARRPYLLFSSLDAAIDWLTAQVDCSIEVQQWGPTERRARVCLHEIV